MRRLRGAAAADWRALERAPFFAAEEAIVGTREVEPGLLEHERVPFVSYPYEWTFSQLRDAALLQLRLLRLALADGLTMKDGSPYNVQWRGARPVFVDVGSFERWRGEPWAGYRQFCALYLYPLLLQAYRDVRFQPWLRGSLEGVEPAEARALLRGRDLLRPGVLTHVVLHNRLDRRQAGTSVRRELREAGFGRELVLANVRRLEKLVRRLDWRPRRSTWSSYGPTTSYDAADAARKEAFVREAPLRGLVWDLGANDGRFSRLAAEQADYVLALDGDAAVLDRLYRVLREEGESRIQPLLVDVADPSPARGWRGVERGTLDHRGRPDAVLCLALLHHLAIARNVPLAEIVAWLRDLGATLVVEFVHPEDPQAQRLLERKRPGLHADYTRAGFEQLLQDAFDVERAETLGARTRTLYLAHPR